MKKFLLFLVAFLVWSLTSSISAQASWRLLSSSNGQIQSHTPYHLQSIKGGSHLCYKNRKPDIGIKLSWGTAEPAALFQIVKAGGGPINCGDRVGLFNDTGGYIKYANQKYGINLKYSQEPIYEWEIRSEGNVKGSPIMPNTPIGLYNVQANDFIRICTRSTPTVDLAWVKDCPNGYRLPGKLADTPLNNLTRAQVDAAIAFVVKLIADTSKPDKGSPK